MKGITIWILGFFAFIAGANVVNALIMWFDIDIGPSGSTPSFLSGLIGPIPVYIYLIISVLATVAFLGGTSHAVVSELSNKDELMVINEKVDLLETNQQSQQKTLESVQARVCLVDESLEHAKREFSKGLSEQGTAIKQSLESGHKTQQKMLDAIQGQVFLLDDNLKGVRKGLAEQAESLKGINENLVDNFVSQLAEIKEADAKQLAELENTLAQIQRREKKMGATVAKQKDEIAEILLKLERVENALAKPEPLLTSQNDVEDIKGIGSGKATELKEIGITNTGEFIMADPKVLAERMGSTEKTVEKLQGRAQLSMVPGLNEKSLFLLEELGINDRKSLALQDPIELSKKIDAIFKVNLAAGKVLETDKPTIEEIDTWIKFAKP